MRRPLARPQCRQGDNQAFLDLIDRRFIFMQRVVYYEAASVAGFFDE